DQLMDRGQRHTGMADQIGESGQAEINTLACNALALAVQRLMLAIFVEGHHGDQAGPGPATRDDMEWRWRLANLLAGPAGELLAHRLDHLPLAGNDLQRLGDILAHLHDAVRAAAGTAG